MASRIRKTSQKIKASSSALRLSLHTVGAMGMWCEYYILLCNVTVFSSISSLAARFRPPYHPNPQAMMTQVCFIIIFAVILKCLAPCAEKCQCTYHRLFEFNFRHQINGDRLAMGSLDLLKDIFHP